MTIIQRPILANVMQVTLVNTAKLLWKEKARERALIVISCIGFANTTFFKRKIRRTRRTTQQYLKMLIFLKSFILTYFVIIDADEQKLLQIDR